MATLELPRAAVPDEPQLAQQVTVVLGCQHGVEELRAALGALAVAAGAVPGVQGLALRDAGARALFEHAGHGQRLQERGDVGKGLRREVLFLDHRFHRRVQPRPAADVHDLLEDHRGVLARQPGREQGGAAGAVAPVAALAVGVGGAAALDVTGKIQRGLEFAGGGQRHLHLGGDGRSGEAQRQQRQRCGVNRPGVMVAVVSMAVGITCRRGLGGSSQGVVDLLVELRQADMPY
jgi:hypothetical protein